MSQISASKLREIAIDLENELKKLSKLETQIKIVEEEIDKNPHLANIFYESLALKLHNFYTGCERIFQIVASELNGGLPSSYDWHRRLLTRMANEQPERPAILTEKTVSSLSEYLGFRHVVRNIYGFELETKRVKYLVQNYYEVWRNFNQDVGEFISWLKNLAGSLEEL